MSISINGLMSGLDTGQIINDLMKLERQPYTRLEQQKSFLTSEQSIFRNINTKLTALKNALSDLKLSSSFNLTSAKSSNESAVKVTTNADAAIGNYNIVVERLATSHSMKSVKSNTLQPGELAQSAKEYLVNGNKIDMSGLKADATNEDVMDYLKNQINKNDWGISASVVTINNQGDKVLTLTSKSTGEDNAIHIGNDPSKTLRIEGTGFDALGFTTSQPAQNAKLKINGIDIEKSTNIISDAISGVTLELLSGNNSNSNVVVSPDGDKVADKIDAFVKAYNDVVTTVRESIAKPADKTKMNPLQGDSLLKEVSDNLYNIFNSMAGTTEGFNMMSQLGLEIDKGITIGSMMTGKISFDKETFKTKLKENPTAVANLFNAEGTGIVNVLDKELKRLTGTTDGLITSRIKGYDTEIEMVDDRLVAMDERLTMKEKQLKAKFTAMEVALSSLKNQQSWLTNQLAALNPSKN
ncbi:flagellar filament capping protein FliD [Paenibacillus sp. IITD108]|uniref:flagellar filament capping protein FliD n=1 Tax=Paenibacillus sp. IITD108 TaxID=3116649 RepID=UPI002F3E445D